jgi:tetratricopeptide (TPR) repeat protein
MRSGEKMMWPCVMVCVVLAMPLSVNAQQPGGEQPAGTSIEEVQAAAERAELEQRWPDALKLYERAYLIDADGYYIYRRAMIYEQMGQDEQALELLSEQREEIAKSPRVTDLPLAIDRINQRVQATPVKPVEPVERSRPVGAWVVTGLGATALVVGGVVWGVGRRDALLLACSASSEAQDDARCEGRESTTRYDQGAWDEAWRKARLTQSAGLASGAVGGAMVVGGIVWMLLEREPVSQAVQWHPVLSPEQAGGVVRVKF